MLDRNATQFERFRGYLCVLASMGLDRQVAHKVDASDIVQQTLPRPSYSLLYVVGLNVLGCLVAVHVRRLHVLSRYYER